MDGIGRSLQQLFHSRASWGVVAVLMLVQAGVATAGGYDGVPWFFERFGLYREGILEGRLWQPLTYALLHGNWLHATLNSLCLLMLGARLEHSLSASLFLKAVLVGVLGGAVGHLALSFGGNEEAVLVGSSGAAIGLLILTTTLSPESRMFPIPISGRLLGLVFLFVSGLLALMDPQLRIPILSDGGRWLMREGFGSWWTISHACHFGGGLSGWLFGRWLLRPRVSLERLRAERAKREMVGPR